MEARVRSVNRAAAQRRQDMIDDIDLKLLKLLSQNSRASLRELARSLGVAVSTVHMRLQKLIREGLIKRFTIIPDYERLGYPITAVILVSVEGGAIEEVASRLREEHNLIAVYDVTGDYDLVLVGKFRSMSDLNSFLKRLNKMHAIKRTVTSVALKVFKEDIVSPLNQHPSL